MDSLIEKVLEGIDPSDPAATWEIFVRIMGLVDWWLLTWVSVLFAVVGALIGWWRGHFWRDLSLALALGPIGWVVSLAMPAATRDCLGCGARNSHRATVCKQCGEALPPVMPAPRVRR
ncbi:hypothetical protein [Tahibacter amnicola]|uniref:Zinc ribbon domain-containing protein n=1 Tax=Tahibacter amnicola TaxID=2976241 RepID=A0ABY6BIP3_9GAMM|nr:hypothetical protein [Tahibacter amnicola]UXI69878.1 hypothetical protein N4264_09695 [Tahibacter amnicola]